MKFPLALVCLLCVTPVLSQPLAEEEGAGRNVAVSRGARRYGDTDATRTSAVIKRPSKTFSAVKQSDQRTNRITQSRKRPAVNTKRRPANSKKGLKKVKVAPLPIEYVARSSMTDQLNQVMDDTLLAYSQSVANKTFRLKVQNMAPNMKINPWAYLAEQSGAEESANMSRSKRETGAAEGVKVEEDEADGLVVDLEDDEEEDAEDAKEELGPAEHDAEDAEDAEKAQEAEEAEDAEADDEMKKFDQQFTDRNASVRSSSSDRFSFSQTPQPLPTADGNVEYKFQLLSQDDLATTRSVETTISEGSERKTNDKFQRTPKRPNAIVEGLEKIKRVGDVQVGTRNGTMRVFDVPIQMGPIRFVMKKSADPQLRNSYVTSPVLTARLRLTESEGQIVRSRIQPTKIRRSSSIVTSTLSKNHEAPSAVDSARLVSHLSREMARIWNSGYLLRRTGRRFKNIINASETDPIETNTSAQIE